RRTQLPPRKGINLSLQRVQAFLDFGGLILEMKFGFPARAAPLRSYNILSFSFRMPQRPFSIALKSMMEALHSNLLKQCPADKRFSENLQKLYLPQNQPSAGRALFASS